MGFVPTIGVSLAEPSLLGNVLSFCNKKNPHLACKSFLRFKSVAGTRGKN